MFLKSSITINETSQFSALKLYKFTLQTRSTYWPLVATLRIILCLCPALPKVRPLGKAVSSRCILSTFRLYLQIQYASHWLRKDLRTSPGYSLHIYCTFSQSGCATELGAWGKGRGAGDTGIIWGGLEHSTPTPSISPYPFTPQLRSSCSPSTQKPQVWGEERVWGSPPVAG